jgi:hypothetical protein
LKWLANNADLLSENDLKWAIIFEERFKEDGVLSKRSQDILEDIYMRTITRYSGRYLYEISMMRVLICGDREWDDYNIIFSTLLRKKALIKLVIHGACRGADMLADRAARELKLPVKPFPISGSEWEQYGLGAGPKRNTRMLEEGMPTVVVAFHRKLNKSKGTKNMVQQSLCARVPVLHWNGKRWKTLKP